MVFCTFIGVNFLDERMSAPERRNLHLKFLKFSRVTPPDRPSSAGGGDPIYPSTAISAVHGGIRPRIWVTNGDAVGRPVC